MTTTATLADNRARDSVSRSRLAKIDAALDGSTPLGRYRADGQITRHEYDAGLTFLHDRRSWLMAKRRRAEGRKVSTVKQRGGSGFSMLAVEAERHARLTHVLDPGMYYLLLVVVGEIPARAELKLDQVLACLRALTRYFGMGEAP